MLTINQMMVLNFINLQTVMKIFKRVLQLMTLFLAIMDYSSCEVYHIIPSNDYPCTENYSCLTLTHFAENVSNRYFIHSNTTLVILGGNHALNSGISVSNTEYLSMFSTNNMSTIITCTAAADFTLSNVTHVLISGLTFTGCGNNSFSSVDHLIIENTTFLGNGSSGSPIIIARSSVQLTKIIISSALGSQQINDRYLSYLQTISSIEYQQYSSITLGGALLVTDGTLLNIDNCTFDGNRANMGGAIFSDVDSNISISNSVFTYNHATGCNEVLCFGSGGALFIGGKSTVIVRNCTFYNNTSGIDGGVAVVFSSTLHILKSCAHNNSAVRDGGVVASFESSYLYIDDTILNNNTANCNGGAIINTKNTITFISNSKFNNNSVGNTKKLDGTQINRDIISKSHLFDCNSYSTPGNGGVLYAENNSSVTIKMTIFINNSATGSGGVMCIQKHSHLAINNCTILNSTAKSGGVFYATEYTSISVSKNSYFERNEANFDGGVAFLEKLSNITIDTSIFNMSEARQFCGGVIYAQVNCMITISATTFTFNKAKTFGGVIYMRQETTVFVSDSRFEHNYAGNNGGVFDCFSGTSIKMYRSNFTDNVAKLKGGVLVMTNENDSSNSEGSGTTNINEVKNCMFIQNSALYAGVFALQRKCMMTIHSSTFNNNTAKVDGGTLYAVIHCNINIINSSFNGNTAINDGVMLASYNSIIVIYGSQFINNTAGFNGGAVYILDKCSTIIENSKFISNRANDSGGTIYERKNSQVTINNSTFDQSTAINSGGVVHTQGNSAILINMSNFTHNIADYGGAVRVYDKSKANITLCNFNENRASISGGAMAAYKISTIAVKDSSFIRNSANIGGVSVVFQSPLEGYVFSDLTNFSHSMRVGSTLVIKASVFHNNSANYGSVLYVQGSTASIRASNLDWNTARFGGGAILATSNSTIRLNMNNISNSAAKKSGGVMSLTDGSLAIILGCTFTSNNAQIKGGVLNIQESKANITQSTFNLSSTDRGTGGAIYTSNSSLQIEHSLFIKNNAGSNGGALHVEWYTALVIICCNFTSNTAEYYGGALCLNKNSYGTIIYSIFHLNVADTGGALASISNCSIHFSEVNKSEIINNNFVTQINNNTACTTGGGIYLNGTILHFRAETNICYNQADKSGGGVHASLSSIEFGSRVQFNNNIANNNGGGISLTNSDLYNNEHVKSTVNFAFNMASCGGGLYVNDSFCSSRLYSPTIHGCFFQHVTKDLMINFHKNSATCGGDDLYGGLLDMCTLDNDINSTLDGISRWKKISNLKRLNTISSQPAKVCHCKSGEPNCNEQIYSIQVKQGEKFKIPVIVVDQVQLPVTASLSSTLNASNVALPRSQAFIKSIEASCYDLEYSISFPTTGQTHKLTINADDHQCNDAKLMVLISVIDCLCPPGLMPAHISTECYCVCDTRNEIFSKYIHNCDSETGTVVRKGKFWITYLSNSENKNESGYLIFPYCQLEYCQPPGIPIHVNLSQPNGSDAQCMNNRIGLLCGSCPPTYSLSLGSAKCIECPHNWHGLLIVIVIAAFIAGIVLVLSLLMFNLTVAVGTLNSIVFYANIIYANKTIYFSHSNLRVITCWLNLDIGFDTCFFDGMDTYAKTWLQLAFPMYIIALVIVIILISSCSSKFSNLIGKKDPVATLATLILLSYTKLLHTVIASFSYVKAEYPNHTTTVRWIRDANIEFGTGKSIALICAAVMILFLGLLYTILVLSWQCLVKFPRSRFFTWTRNHKLCTFISTYHTPHTAKHRYWPGLLLLVRVMVYLIAAFSASSDQPITLLSTVLIMCCLLFYKTRLVIRVYRNWLLNTMESFVYLNIAVFAAITMFTFNSSSNNASKEISRVIASLSIGSILLLILFIIIFHVYRYGNTKVYTFIESLKLCKLLKPYDQNRRQWMQSDDTLLDAIDNPRVESDADYISSSLVLPTSSIVSMTNTERTSESTSFLNQSTQESLSSLQDHDKSHNEVYSLQTKSRPIIKSSTTNGRSLEMSNFGNTQKAASKSPNFTNEKLPSIMKPLLEESQ